MDVAEDGAKGAEVSHRMEKSGCFVAVKELVSVSLFAQLSFH